jgi:hypothetical protein
MSVYWTGWRSVLKADVAAPPPGRRISVITYCATAFSLYRGQVADMGFRATPPKEHQLRPTSIRIFLAEGRPDGIRVVEKSNWTGVALVSSRADIAVALHRAEFGGPGVYVLTGPSDDGTSPVLYIGEADVLRDRLKTHVREKDFWTQLIAFTSKDESLNKAHARYLEAKLVKLARKANQWELLNSNNPTEPGLSEMERADADWFLEEMLMIYPLLGVDAFEDASSELAQRRDDELLYLNSRGASGVGVEASDGFLVQKGARGRVDVVDSIHDYLVRIRRELLEQAILQPDGDMYVLAQDYRFKSPSTAASVLMGRSANGRVEWKAQDGRTLKSIQEAAAEEAE